MKGIKKHHFEVKEIQTAFNETRYIHYGFYKNKTKEYMINGVTLDKDNNILSFSAMKPPRGQEKRIFYKTLRKYDNKQKKGVKQ